MAPFAVSVHDDLTETEAEAVRTAVRAVAAADGVEPMSEDAWLEVRPGSTGTVHLTAEGPAGEIVGYGQLDPGGEDVAEVGAELLVVPDARRHGLGRTLGRAMMQTARDRWPSRQVALWAHGDRPGSAELAAAFGLERVRELWQMRAPLTDPIAEPVVPAGVTIRTFVPGRDEPAWLALNAAAFAHHPEQGGWTRADLELREAEDWFDPAGFFLAEADGQVVGAHWTKVHPATTTDPALGEIYVLGIAPAAAGRGLGKVLTAVGLRHLQHRGLDGALLYVESDNAPAIAIYERAGFRRFATDVRYRTPWSSGGAVPQASGRATIS